MVVAAVHGTCFIFMEIDAAVTVINQVSQLLPDDGVHAPDLGCALQNTEGLGEGLGLVCRSQGCPVTTATNSRGGGGWCRVRGAERRKMDRHMNTHFSAHMCTVCVCLHTGVHTCSVC